MPYLASTDVSFCVTMQSRVMSTEYSIKRGSSISNSLSSYVITKYKYKIQLTEEDGVGMWLYLTLLGSHFYPRENTTITIWVL